MFISPSGTSLKSSLTKTLFFGHEPTPELLGILVVYFVQGILGLARLAVSFFLKDELGLSPAEVSALFGIVALPWIVKPLFGFISDGLPILGYRRRPYLILSGILGALSWAGLATIVQTSTAATLALAVGSLSVAIGDVIVDSLVVERARAESQGEVGSLQSLCWGTSAFGGLITAYFSGLLLEHFSTRTIFWITASFPLIVSGVAWLIAESPVTEKPDLSTVKHQFEELRKAITQKAIWLPAAFVFIWQATPTADAAFFFFTTNELGFEPEFLGRVRLVTSIASLVGVWLFHRFLKNVPFRVIFGWSTLLSAVLGMSMLLLVTHTNRALGIDDHWFSIGDNLILTVMGQIAYMPVLVLAARLCPPGVEATLFALLMSISNLGGLLSYQFGALLMHLMGITQTNFSNLWILVVIANVSTLLPLPFLSWLPATDATQPSEAAMEIETDTTPTKLGQSLLPELMSELVPQSLLQQPAEEPAE
ncbi:folate/biopterin family MFS transporter [Gloeocapsopsis sp. IPPAS B-1203]|uniref:folate/biopterin family MFS transporter n=1 Tax=Gloeocapsopsis sp. IPPAS B-1203 TaxID=2049454 RepID=UPI000C18EA8A|nr:folate/biopterin family MFS transporter [Gloeocapsopsis sp. IPPAS B-1203]PIG94772.1 folate/biopterin family MFS transporter [Gloeocapsopsis sp. IPPAS B-1203]